MFVRHLYADQWREHVDQGVGIVDPSWDAIHQAILALDATTKTIVTLADREWSDYFMLIAGSWEGRVLVNATKNNQIFFSLVDPTRPEKTRMLCVGGQNEEFEDCKLVPVAWAIEAAQHFFETGDRKTTMNWRRDD